MSSPPLYECKAPRANVKPPTDDFLVLTGGTSYKGPGGTGARKDKSTHAKFFCNQVQKWWSLSSNAALGSYIWKS